MEDQLGSLPYTNKDSEIIHLKGQKFKCVGQLTDNDKTMFKEGILSFLTKSQFLKFIKRIVDKALYEEFQPIFLEEFSKFLKKFGNDQKVYRFPCVKVDSPELLRAKISLFITQYKHQYKENEINKQDNENVNDYPSTKLPLIKTNSCSDDTQTLFQNSRGTFTPKARKIQQSQDQENLSKKKGTLKLNQNYKSLPHDRSSSDDDGKIHHQVQNTKAKLFTSKINKSTMSKDIAKKYAIWAKINQYKIIRIQDQEVDEQEDQQIDVNQFYEVPEFLTKKFKSFCTLVSYDVTNKHILALNEVRNLITKQLQEDKKDGLLQTYQAFFKQYLIFLTIKNHQWDNQLKAEQFFREANCNISSYLQQRTSSNLQQLKEGPLLKSWKYIFSKLPQLVQQKQDFFYRNNLRENIRQILLKGLTQIYLLNTNNLNFYGVNSKNLILINVNHSRKQNEQEFRKETIKVYLYVCIVHELTHYLLRQLKDFQIKQYSRSFSSKQKSFGARFMKDFVQRSSPFPDYLKIRRRQFITNHNSLVKICSELEDKTISIQEQLISLKSKDVFNKDYFYIKNYLGGHLQLSNLFRKVSLENIGQIQRQWNKFFLYVDKMVSDKSGAIDSWCQSDQSQKTFRFLFTIFLTEDIAFSLFPFLKNRQEQYEKYKNKLHNFEGNKYCIQDNQFLKFLASQLGEQLLKENDVSAQNETEANFSYRLFARIIAKPITIKYSKFLLKQKMTPDRFKQNVSRYSKQLKLQQLSIEHILGNCLEWKATAQFTIIEPILLSQFIRVKRQNEGLNFIAKELLNRQLLNKEVKGIIPNLIQLETYCGLLTQFLHYFQLIIIYYQLPVFFNPSQAENQPIQAGYQMEKVVFPYLKQSKMAYSANYQNMKKIEKKSQRNKIGQQPKDPRERLKNVILYKEGKESKPFIDLRNRECLNDTLTRNRDKINKEYEFWLKCKNLVLQAKKHNVKRSLEEWQDLIIKVYQGQNKVKK